MNIETEIERVDSFVQKGNYHAAYNIALSGLNACHRQGDQAYNIALSGLNACHRQGDQAGTDQFIDIIKAVVDSLAAEFGSQAH